MTYAYQEQLNLFESPVLPLNKQLGNMKLVDYGIQNEESDYRVHVCGIYNVCYVFQTKRMSIFVEKNVYPTRSAYIGKTETAIGHIVPITDAIDRGVVVAKTIPMSIWVKCPKTKDGETSIKGIWAVGIAKKAIEKGIITFGNIESHEVISKVEQVKGKDLLIVNNKINVQVKCDLRACLKTQDPYGTNNLFIQIKECNPTKQY